MVVDHSDVCVAAGSAHAVAAKSATLLGVQKYVAAATAAGVAEVITMPLDVTKTRMQLSGEGVMGPRRGMFATARAIHTQSGVRGLFVGVTPAVLRQAIVGGIGVGLYPQIKDVMVKVQRREDGVHVLQALTSQFTSSQTPAAALPAASNTRAREGAGPVPSVAPVSFGTKVVAGATSGVIGQILAAPTCVVKVRLQADARKETPRYQGMTHAFRIIPQQEGWRALFAGIVPSLQRAAVMYGATVSTYDEAKSAIIKHVRNGDPAAADQVSTHVLASSCSGLVASLVSCPFDTIKTRIINQPVLPRKPILGLLQQPSPIVFASPATGVAATATTAAAAASSSAAASEAGVATVANAAARPVALYSSTLDCVVKTVRSEGVRALYKGFVPCYARLAPWQLTFFVVYERICYGLNIGSTEATRPSERATRSR